MIETENIKLWIISAFGIIGGIITTSLGGWDMALQTLIIFMGIDYVTGLIVAGVFKQSKKTESGGLQSKVGFKGLCKKGLILLIVLVAVRLDLTMGTNFLRDTVIIGYIVNESISIIENAGLMGVPIPPSLRKAIDTLASKEV